MSKIKTGVVIYLLGFTGPVFAELRYFDRQMIVDNNIKEIHELINSENRKETDEDWYAACIIYIYEFDKRGNIRSSGPARVGTKYGYQYNELNQLIDWTWEDRYSDEITYFSEEMKQNLDDFKIGLKEREARIFKELDSKIDFRDNSEMLVSDTCASINAYYSVELIKENNNLPIELKLSHIKESANKIYPNETNSPKILYMYYDYKFFNKEQTK